jgi:copper chaperone CopZ
MPQRPGCLNKVKEVPGTPAYNRFHTNEGVTEMMNHSLQLASVLDVAGVAKVTQALQSIAGVGEVDARPGADRIAVTFDADKTSAMELATAVARTGHAVRQPKPHGAGSCCGGCGGH